MALDKTQKPKWYFSYASLIAAFLFAGPFALPLVWLNPGFSKRKKLIITIAILFITYLLAVLVNNSVKTIKEYYHLAF